MRLFPDRAISGRPKLLFGGHDAAERKDMKNMLEVICNCYWLIWHSCYQVPTDLVRNNLYQPLGLEFLKRLDEMQLLWKEDRWTDSLTKELRSIRAKAIWSKRKLMSAMEGTNYYFWDYEYGKDWSILYNGPYGYEGVVFTYQDEESPYYDEKTATEEANLICDADFLDSVMDGEYDSDDDRLYLNELQWGQPLWYDRES